MALSIKTDRPPLAMDAHGVARVGGSRVTLDTVIGAYKSGASAEMIVDQYATLKLEDVYFAIGYYKAHTKEVEEYLRLGEEQADRVRAKIDASGHQRDLRERLLARRARKQG